MYEDRGISGKNISGRLGLKELPLGVISTINLMGNKFFTNEYK